MKPPMGISAELQLALSRSFNIATDFRHDYVNLIHILYGLLQDSTIEKLFTQDQLDTINRMVLINLESIAPVPMDGPYDLPKHTKKVENILYKTVINTKNNKISKVGTKDLFIAIYKDASLSSYFEEINFKMEDSYLALEYMLPEPTSSSSKNTDNLLKYSVDLINKAYLGKIDPVLCRDTEIERTVHVLSRKKKNNVVYIGDPGVGKTAVVEGLAYKILKGDVPKCLKHAKLYSLDIGALMAGTKYRGELEERVNLVIADLANIPNSIVFIDELHTIVGAGSATNSMLDIANLLKPALAEGKFRCIGATTYPEYRLSIEKDKALSRRFEKVYIEEPSLEDALVILKGVKSYYEKFHNITYTPEAIESVVKLSSVYIKDRFLPDKAIDIIDEAGAQEKIKKTNKGVVTVDSIETIISKICGISVKNISQLDKSSLKNLESTLQSVIFGQDSAISKVVASIKMAKIGLRSKTKPIGSFLFAGPTGVGKTELAKQLAQALGVPLLRYDMSEYSEKHNASKFIGAPPGYVGFDQGGLFIEDVRKKPNSVIVLDEIEKAHPDMYNLLLQIMDNATLTDNSGRKADFKNTVLIMTTNAGAQEMTQKTMGFESLPAFQDESKATKSLERVFTPEFRNRLDSIIYFHRLPSDILLNLVDKEIQILSESLKEYSITVEVSHQAKLWLAQKGYNPEMGARPMSRLFDTALKQPISDLIINEEANTSDSIFIDCHDKELTFTCRKPVTVD